MTVKNKHAVVTGGGTGVGEAIALKLADDFAFSDYLRKKR